MEIRTTNLVSKIGWLLIIGTVGLAVLSFAAGYQVGNARYSLNPFSFQREKTRLAGVPGLAPPETTTTTHHRQEGSPRQISLRPVERLAEVYVRLQQYFYDPDKLDEEKLTLTAINGLLLASGDQYVRYLKPSDLEQFQSRSHGEYEGIGAELSITIDPLTFKDRITIMGVFPEQPAEKVGLRPLDIILKIDGKPTDDMSLDQAVNLIRGHSGTKVTLTIQREGIPEPFDVTITRQKVKIPVLQKRMLKDNVGYIRLLEFNEKTAGELSKALDDLKGQGMKALILDLRRNPGGLLEAAVDVSSVFVPKGPIVTVKSRTEGEQVFEAIPSRYKNWQVPMMVIVNQGSASASEIVAGALKDHKIAEVVGEKTFGKASVQTVINLRDGGAVVITTGSYLTPSGYDIHANKGVEPNIKLEPTPEEKQHNVRLTTTWIERGKQHLQANELVDAYICFRRARELDKENKEAAKLINESLRRIVERDRQDANDTELERVRQMLLQRVASQKPQPASR